MNPLTPDLAQRAVLGEFVKRAGKPLELNALTVIEELGDHFIRRIYDVDLSRKWGYLFHESGAGGSCTVPVHGIYHVSGNIAVKERPTNLVDARDRPPWRSKKTLAIRALNRTRRLRSLPPSFRGCADLLDWLERNGIQQDAVWCSECRDFVPGDILCEHCWWCDKSGWYSTPSDRRACANQQECAA